MDLTTKISEQGDWAVVQVFGDLDMATAPGLRTQLVGMITEGRHHVILDLEMVDFVDSLGLGVIIGAVRRARASGGDVRLVSNRSPFLRTLEVIGMDRALPPHPTVEAAISAAGPEG